MYKGFLKQVHDKVGIKGYFGIRSVLLKMTLIGVLTELFFFCYFLLAVIKFSFVLTNFLNTMYSFDDSEILLSPYRYHCMENALSRSCLHLICSRPVVCAGHNDIRVKPFGLDKHRNWLLKFLCLSCKLKLRNDDLADIVLFLDQFH